MSLNRYVETSLYVLLLLLRLPTCSNLSSIHNFILLISAVQPMFSVWYFTKFHIVRTKPRLYQDFRVKEPPLAAVILTVIANSWPGESVPVEFLVSGLLAIMSVGLCRECNRHIEHTFHVLSTNVVLALLIAPGCGPFIFLFVITCLITIILFDVRRCFSVSEYVLANTFLSFAMYKAIFDTNSLFVLLCLVSIAVFLVIPPQLDTDTVLILLALLAWIAVIFSKNMSHHLNRLDHIVKDTLADLTEHWILVGIWSVCSTLAIIFTLQPCTRLNLHVTRKLFHVLVCIVFVSGIATAPQLLTTACTLLTFAMFFCEVSYYRGASTLKGHLSKFRGAQDEDPLVLTPLCLLLGLSLPVWLRFGMFSEGLLPSRLTTTFLQGILPYSGVMTVGVGDACAAIVGTSFGRVKLPGTHKTMEGLLGNMAGQVLFLVLIGPYLSWGSRSPSDVITLAGVILGSSVLEVYTQDIDNLVVPIFTVLCISAV